MWKRMQQISVMRPRIQFCAEPKSALPEPPPKDAAPTLSSEKPMAVTTVEETIGEISLIQYFAKRPRIPSTIPPTSTAPMMAP